MTQHDEKMHYQQCNDGVFNGSSFTMAVYMLRDAYYRQIAGNVLEIHKGNDEAND
jgi:hypothetical protein